MQPKMIWKIVFWTWFVVPLVVAIWQIDFTLKVLGALVLLFFWYVVLGWWHWRLFWLTVDERRMRNDGSYKG